MPNSETERIRLNRRLDELIQHVVLNDVGIPDFRAQYAKTFGLLRRVAEHDPVLARELLLSIFMFSYTSAIGVTSGIFRQHASKPPQNHELQPK